MGVTLCTYAKHTIVFDGLTLVDPGEVIARLNALHLEDSPLLLKLCGDWYLQHAGGKHDWRYWDCDDEEIRGDEYEFNGPYHLTVYVARDWVRIEVGMKIDLFWLRDCQYAAQDRLLLRAVFRQIIHSLGGEYALYFPDYAYTLAEFAPENRRTAIDLDDLITLVRRKYRWCVDSYAEAEELNGRNIRDGLPFFVDRFEDLE